MRWDHDDTGARGLRTGTHRAGDVPEPDTSSLREVK